MVVLSAMPAQNIIDGFKGIVDFYLWKGIPCARAWPHWKPREPTAPERANQERFAYINKIAKDVPEFIKDNFRNMAAGTPLTWKDLFVQAYMKGTDLV